MHRLQAQSCNSLRLLGLRTLRPHLLARISQRCATLDYHRYVLLVQLVENAVANLLNVLVVQKVFLPLLRCLVDISVARYCRIELLAVSQHGLWPLLFRLHYCHH